MTSEGEEEAVMRLNRDRPIVARYRSDPPSYAGALLISPPSRLPPVSMRPHHTSTKPNPRLLSFFLQAVVMIIVITLFFLFLGIAAIVLIHICVAGRALHHRRHHRTTTHFSNSIEEDVDFGVGLSLMDLQKLPCFNYGAVVKRISTRDCAVCLEGFREGESCRILPGCKHVFHANCIDAWLIKASSCPICRGVVELKVEVGLAIVPAEILGK